MGCSACVFKSFNRANAQGRGRAEGENRAYTGASRYAPGAFLFQVDLGFTRDPLDCVRVAGLRSSEVRCGHSWVRTANIMHVQGETQRNVETNRRAES